MSSGKRPEHQAPPELYYNEEEAKKYTKNSRIIEVQEKCTERALELLALPEEKSCFLLDLGCGSGLSGEVLSDNDHSWVGFDISKAMLDIALQREVEGGLILSDLGQGLPLRAASFDGAVSISAIQWLCNSDKRGHIPAKRLGKFFTTLYACLCRGSRAVFQFYPENDHQVELIVSQALRAGFTGGLVVDFPNSTKAKKIYLVLMVGGGEMPVGLSDDGPHKQTQALYQRRERTRGYRGKNLKKEWIKRKKERWTKQGKEVRPNTKYTGRKRSGKF